VQQKKHHGIIGFTEFVVQAKKPREEKTLDGETPPVLSFKKDLLKRLFSGPDNESRLSLD
jgi:hypothetical protein